MYGRVSRAPAIESLSRRFFAGSAGQAGLFVPDIIFNTILVCMATGLMAAKVAIGSGLPFQGSMQDQELRTLKLFDGFGDWKDVPDIAEAAVHILSKTKNFEMSSQGLEDVRQLVQSATDMNPVLQRELRESKILERKLAALIVLGCRGKQSLPAVDDIVDFLLDNSQPMGARVWAVISLSLIEPNQESITDTIRDFYFEILDSADQRPPSKEPVGVSTANKTELFWAETVLRCISTFENIRSDEFDQLAVELLNRPQEICFDYDLLERSTAGFALEQMKLALASDFTYESDPQLMATWSRRMSALVTIGRSPDRYSELSNSVVELVERLSKSRESDGSLPDDAAVDIVLCCAALTALGEYDMYSRDLLERARDNLKSIPSTPNSWLEAARVACSLAICAANLGERASHADEAIKFQSLGRLPGGFQKPLFVLMAYRARVPLPNPEMQVPDIEFPLLQWMLVHSRNDFSEAATELVCSSPACFSFEFLTPNRTAEVEKLIQSMSRTDLRDLLDAYASALTRTYLKTSVDAKVLDLVNTYDPIVYSGNFLSGELGISDDWSTLIAGLIENNPTIINDMIMEPSEPETRFNRMMLLYTQRIPIPPATELEIKSIARNSWGKSQSLAIKILDMANCKVDVNLCRELVSVSNIELNVTVYNWLLRECPNSNDAVELAREIGSAIKVFPIDSLGNFDRVEYRAVDTHPVVIRNWTYIFVE